MSLLFAVNPDAFAIPPIFWVWGSATFLLATGLGFVGGVTYANRSVERGIRNAAKKMSSLYAIVLDALDKAHRVATLLEEFPQISLSADETDQLDKKRSSLLEATGRVVDKQRVALAKKAEAKLKPKPQPVKLEWKRTSLDPATNLPDRSTFDANLQMMLESSAESETSSGLLLVKIDRNDHLKTRFGILGADVFLKKMAAVIQRAVREQDLACRISVDTFGVLIPYVDAESGRKLSQAIRNTVRVHNFRLEEGGPDVLVTASFGSTLCPPNDDPETALSRAGDALAQSIRRGRNHLHMFDGEAVVHCTAG